MVNPIKVSSLSSASVKAQLREAGIDTNSKQYKAAIRQTTSHPESAGMFTNVQAIKNLMSSYDSNGDWIDLHTGLTGLLVNEYEAAIDLNKTMAVFFNVKFIQNWLFVPFPVPFVAKMKNLLKMCYASVRQEIVKK